MTKIEDNWNLGHMDNGRLFLLHMHGDRKIIALSNGADSWQCSMCLESAPKHIRVLAHMIGVFSLNVTMKMSDGAMYEFHEP